VQAQAPEGEDESVASGEGFTVCSCLEVGEDLGFGGLSMSSIFVQKYFLADARYALCDGLLTPYHGIQYHLKEWGWFLFW
jgi:hypothetical protein